MTDYKDQPNPSKRKTDAPSYYIESSNIEAHIIADMLRIEHLTNELKDFKEESRKRFDKLEGWIIGIVGVTVTTLLATVGSILFKVAL
jgi:hypothetical protein